MGKKSKAKPKRWYDKRTDKDAPKDEWMSLIARTAWADGWNAAVEAYVTEFADTLDEELKKL